MSSHSSGEESKGYSPHMRGVALGILLMGISLAIIIVLYIMFGHMGPTFSTGVMQKQQEVLREQYGLPPSPPLSPEMQLVPPSLRSIVAGGGGNATNATTTSAGGNATNATTTTSAGGGGNATSASAGGGTSVSIVSGASTLTNTAFKPNPATVHVGDTVTWTNDDTQPHTVTSGSNGTPDNKFNSSPNFNPLLSPGQTFQHKFTAAGQYPYFCQLHPNMVGTVSVS